MKHTSIIMINENNQKDLSHYEADLRNVNDGDVTLRCSMSGSVPFEMKDISIPMKYPLVTETFDNRVPIIGFKLYSDVIDNIRRSTGPCLIELPMGYVIEESYRIVDADAINEQAKQLGIITSHKESNRNTVWKKTYYHVMNITHLYQFLKTVGALPFNESPEWTGVEYAQNNALHSTMLFKSYFQFRKMSKQDAIKYVQTMSTPISVMPKRIGVSDIYQSTIAVFHARSLYVPLKPESPFYTYPDSYKRLIYFYDCVQSWVVRSTNNYMYKRSEETRTLRIGNQLVYKIEQIQPTSTPTGPDISTPNFTTLGIFENFTNSRLTPSEKIKSVKKLFSSLGHEISIELLSGVEEDYFTDEQRRIYRDPLDQFEKTVRTEVISVNQPNIAMRLPPNHGYREPDLTTSAPRNIVVPAPRNIAVPAPRNTHGSYLGAVSSRNVTTNQNDKYR